MGRKGGKARAKALTAKRRQEIARMGGRARMAKARKQVDLLDKGAAKRAKGAISSMEKSIQRGEEWLRLAAEGSQIGLWFWNQINNHLYWDRTIYQMLGVDPGVEPTLEIFWKLVHPGDVERVQDSWHYRIESVVPTDVEYRVERADGTLRWIHSRSRIYLNKTKKSRDVIGVAFDVTESREYNKERDDLARRLVTAQEEERSRLASDLRYKVGQKLLLATIALQKVLKAADNPQVASQLAEVLKTVDEIVTDAHSLSEKLVSLRPLP